MVGRIMKKSSWKVTETGSRGYGEIQQYGTCILMCHYPDRP